MYRLKIVILGFCDLQTPYEGKQIITSGHRKIQFLLVVNITCIMSFLINFVAQNPFLAIII